jgi:hypothetical protein
MSEAIIGKILVGAGIFISASATIYASECRNTLWTSVNLGWVITQSVLLGYML